MSDTTSDHAVLLSALDFAAAEFDSAIYEEAAATIRALEAKVAGLESSITDIFDSREGYREKCDRLAAELVEKDAAWMGEKSRAHHWEQDCKRYAAEAISWNKAYLQAVADRDRLAADAERWQRDVADAYGWLWCVNEEPATPNRFPAERAAYNARKLLRELLTHEQRGIGINNAVIQRDAARRAGEE